MIHYNKTILSNLLTSLAVFTRSNITVYEVDGEVDTEIHSSTSMGLCTGVKEFIRENCLASDRKASEEAKSRSEAFYYYCHFGMIEIIMKYAINKDNSVILLLGPFRDPKHQKKDIQNIIAFCSTFKKDADKMIKDYRKVPRFTLEKFEAIKNLSNVIMEYGQTTKLISSKENFIEDELSPYVKKHIAERLTIERIAKDLNTTEKTLERIVSLYTGLSPKKYVQQLRIQKAYEDILYTSDSLPSIASAVGYDDYNYFIKVFKSVKGITPSKARKQLNKNF